VTKGKWGRNEKEQGEREGMRRTESKRKEMGGKCKGGKKGGRKRGKKGQGGKNTPESGHFPKTREGKRTVPTNVQVGLGLLLGEVNV